MAQVEDRARVLAGERISVSVYEGGERVQREAIVLPACDQNHGQWACVTCDEHFSNNMEKDSHCHEAIRPSFADCSTNHRLVWRCFLHGYEQA